MVGFTLAEYRRAIQEEKEDMSSAKAIRTHAQSLLEIELAKLHEKQNTIQTEGRKQAIQNLEQEINGYQTLSETHYESDKEKLNDLCSLFSKKVRWLGKEYRYWNRAETLQNFETGEMNYQVFLAERDPEYMTNIQRLQSAFQTHHPNLPVPPAVLISAIAKEISDLGNNGMYTRPGDVDEWKNWLSNVGNRFGWARWNP